MKCNRRTQAALLILGLPAVLLCLLVWLTWREVRQSRLNHALILALRNREIAHVVALLHQGADPNARDVPERPLTWRDLLNRWLRHSSALDTADTALMVAVRGGIPEEADSLLRAGANPNLVNAAHETPISVALNANVAVAALIRNLLMHGANPNARVIDNRTPADRTTVLIKIMSTDFDEPNAGHQLVKLLLERGADVQATDEFGQSPLQAAVSQGDAVVAQWLMERGADINHGDQEGYTPLVASADVKKAEDWGGHASRAILAELLRRGVDIIPAHNGGWNLLICAAEQDNVSVLETAIRRGIPVDSHDKMQRTPLMFAAAYGNLSAIKSLLARGATVDARDANGWTALMFAAQHGDITMMRVLLQHGANPTRKDQEHGWTVAQRAASVGQDQAARWLRANHPLQTAPPADRQQAWRVQSTQDNVKRLRVPVDAHRWIEVSRTGDDGDSGDSQAVMMDRDGRHGAVMGLEYWYIPRLRIFADTDGRRYAWFMCGHPHHSQLLVEIDGLDLKKRGERDSTHMSDETYCQPLPGGGALLVVFRRRRDLNRVPASHRDDDIAQVTRFRDGKLTDLGLLFMPEQQQ